MDTNNNLQQINTFTKGMNTDVSDLYIPSDQYRMAKNLRLTLSGDSNQGELHLIEGNTLYELTDYNGNNVKFEEILATTSVANYGVIVSKETVDVPQKTYRLSLGYGSPNQDSVYITYSNNNEDDLVDLLIIEIYARVLVDGYIQERIKLIIYNPGELTKGGVKEISFAEQGTSLQIEAASIESCKITGNNIYIFSIPESEDKTFSNDKTKAEAFSIWRFTENKNSCRRIFGPCVYNIWASGIDLTTKYESENNIMLYILTGIRPIFYIDLVLADYENVNFIPNTAISDIDEDISLVLEPADITLQGGGSLPVAKIQYAYRYVNITTGKYSQLSPLSKIISIYKDANSGYDAPSSTKSALITIPFTKTTAYDHIQIFRIQPDEINPKVYKVYDDEKIKSFTDDGTQGSLDTQFANYYNLLSNTTVPNVFSSKGGSIYSDTHDNLLSGNRLYQANIKDITTDIDLRFKDIDTRSFSSGMYFMKDKEEIYILNEKGKIINKPETDEYLFHKAFENNPYGEYKDLYWKVGNSEGGTGDYFDWKYVYKDSYISDSYQTLDMNNPVTTFKYGEIYRFGVILYDLDGNRSSVKWIADIQMPEQPSDYMSDYLNMAIHDNVYGLREVKYKVKSVGIRFTLKRKIPNCSLIEIVRCIRNKDSDTYNISQGISGFPVKCMRWRTQRTGDVRELTQGERFPYGPMSLQEVHLSKGDIESEEYTFAKQATDIILFASPEYLYGGYGENGNSFIDIVGEGGLTRNIHLKFLYNYLVDFVGGPTEFRFSGDGWPRFSIQNQENYVIKEWDKLVHTRGIKHINDYMLRQYTNGSTNVDNPWTKCTPSLNVCVPKRFDSVNSNRNVRPKTIKYPTIQGFNSFFKDEDKTFNFGHHTIIGDKNFMNWSSFFVEEYYDRNLNIDGNDFKDLYYWWHYADDDTSITRSPDHYVEFFESGAYSYPVGLTGKCVLFEVDENAVHPEGTWYSTNDDIDSCKSLMITITNIVKTANPYGGYNKDAIDASSYYGFGDVYSNNAGSSFDIVSGDAYIKMFKYSSMYAISSTSLRRPYTASFIYCVPVVTEIDLLGSYGHLYNSSMDKDELRYLQYYECEVPKGWTIDRDNIQNIQWVRQTVSEYTYNRKYSALYYALAIAATNKLIKSSSSRISRIEYSEVGEWNDFLPTNYIDVDSKHGEITCLAAYKDKLIFWQQNAIGYISVNEKTAVVDENTNSVQLGTGDLLKKPFYISTVHGMKPKQLCYCITSDGLYWWDGYNKEILRFNERSGIQRLSKIKNVQQYLTNGAENKKPHMYYDIQNNEVICSCVNNESIIFNEFTDSFTSVYTFDPIYNIDINDKHYSLDKKNIYINNTNYDGFSHLFGNDAFPYLKYVVNKQQQTKVFNTFSFSGSFYGNSANNTDYEYHLNLQHSGQDNSPLSVIDFVFKTPLNQEGRINGKHITNRECDFRAVVPRAGKLENNKWTESSYGDRLRGRTMECELISSSNSTDFSLLYINTKFNISCS